MSRRPLLLDLFCGAGGAAMGYHRAGFDVVGIDLNPQPSYPFPWYRADWAVGLAELADVVDVVHASPPCHDHSRLAGFRGKDGTGELLPRVVDALVELGRPWVVENVDTHHVVMAGWWFTLCGSAFGLRVRRHRRFGSSHLMLAPPCAHRVQGTPAGVYGHGGATATSEGKPALASQYGELMGMPWARPAEIAQAIPPVYTEWIGAHLITALEEAAS